MLADRLIDILIIQVPVDYLLGLGSKKIFEDTLEILVNHREIQSKPVIVLSPHGSAVSERLEFEKRLAGAKIPTYPTFEQAAKAIANVNWYFRFHRSQNV
ncbi:MAG: hypothetical protein SVY10_09195 [Thermodesulfobacteriota bacterium]|nr:hypothetical protein [Thermodesulfobacteriota bacterium]